MGLILVQRVLDKHCLLGFMPLTVVFTSGKGRSYRCHLGSFTRGASQGNGVGVLLRRQGSIRNSRCWTSYFEKSRVVQQASTTCSGYNPFREQSHFLPELSYNQLFGSTASSITSENNNSGQNGFGFRPSSGHLVLSTSYFLVSHPFNEAEELGGFEYCFVMSVVEEKQGSSA